MAGNRKYSVGYEFNARDGGFQRVMGSMSSSMDKLKKQVSLLGFAAALDITRHAANAARSIANVAIEASKLSAKAEGIRKGFEQIGNANLLQNLRDATKGTVADMDLMSRAVQASNFQIPLESLAKLLEFASARAIQTGQSVDYLVDSIVMGIGRKSPLILDNLGISAVRLREMLKGVGTETASVGDIATVVGKIAEEELAKMGGIAETTSLKFQQMAASAKNLKENFGTLINSSSAVQGTLSDLSQTIENLALKSQMKTDKRLGWLERTFWTKEQYKDFLLMQDYISARLLKFKEKVEDLGTPVQIQTIAALRDEIKKLQEQYENTDITDRKALETINDKIKAHEQLIKSLKEEKKTQAEILRDLKELNRLENSQGYKTLGYGYKGDMPSGANLKFKSPKWSMGTPGLQSYGGLSSETRNIILENNKIEENMMKINGVIGELNNSFANLFYNVGNGWKGMIDSMLNSFRMLVAQIAAKAVVFAILNALSGGTSGLAKAAGGIVGGGFKNFLGFANGTNFAPGGWSVVGEKGPELLNLPRGSRVIPNINGSTQLTGQFKIAGRDLYLVLNRYSRELGTNT